MAGHIANNYGSLQAVFSHGQGALLFDREGRRYIDFTAGIGVNCLGHNHPALVQALRDQAAKQIHISNYYNSDVGLAYADELLAAAHMDGVFFCNSGAEANEAAIKLARKYGWLLNGKKPGRQTIVSLRQSFHGRTLASLAATGQDKFHPAALGPYPEGFACIDCGDYDSLKTAFDSSAALLIETVQGEGGVNLVDPDWARAAAEAARNCGALVIVDEVQTGMGRTGSLFACEQLGIEPDVITLAKGIAGGVPMGACLFRGRADVFEAGDHQSTFGGNPLACACARAVLKELTQSGFFERVNVVGNRIRQTIEGWGLPSVSHVRGRGLMIGMDIAGDAPSVQRACLEAGLCISTAGAHILRLLPPLIISDGEACEGLSILKSILEKSA